MFSLAILFGDRRPGKLLKTPYMFFDTKFKDSVHLMNISKITLTRNITITLTIKLRNRILG